MFSGGRPCAPYRWEPHLREKYSFCLPMENHTSSCDHCGCGCAGICHTIYSCNGLWVCGICRKSYPTCQMESLRFLVCGRCGEESGSFGVDRSEETCWRPPYDRLGLWDFTENFYQEVMFLSYMKLRDCPEATELLTRCIMSHS